MTPKQFHFIEEEGIGQQWLDFFNQTISSYQKWFFKEGEFNRPDYLSCQQALKKYMPELLPFWQNLIKTTKADDVNARLLSFYNPAPYISGCSQAVWTRYNPILVRNYDYDPALCEGRILKSKWHKTEVIASTDCLWGVLDGMNEHGLIVSLSFGGKEAIGDGFGMPIILRYILEFCKTSNEAIEVLQSVPSNMAYNITILDAHFQVNTIEVSPASSAHVSHIPLAVNHQGDFELTNYAMFSKSYERKQTLINNFYNSYLSVEGFIDSFEYAPLYADNYEEGFGTLYTSIYNPTLKAMEYRWPQQNRHYQSFTHFNPQKIWVYY